MNLHFALPGDETIYRLGWTLIHTLWAGAAVAVLLASAVAAFVFTAPPTPDFLAQFGSYRNAVLDAAGMLPIPPTSQVIDSTFSGAFDLQPSHRFLLRLRSCR